MACAKSGQKINVDLGTQKITAGNHQFGFDVEPFRKHCLMNGLDDIGLTLAKMNAIGTYEQKQKTASAANQNNIFASILEVTIEQ